MPMNSTSSRTILEVERAIGDLRRGLPVILTKQGTKVCSVLSGEHNTNLPATSESTNPAVQLMKLAGLLPLAVEQPLPALQEGLLTVGVEAIRAYPAALAVSLEKVSEANVPLPEANHARFVAFRPRLGHAEHLAIVIGNPTTHPAPFVRLHSSCVTGDIFGSLRCDCGTQLHKALHMIAEAGAGTVLYLNQEGRGIGIANKLRAYALQDKGMDTVEANLALGFEADERDFAIAASMLKMLGSTSITLLTNNPMKVEAMTKQGIEVAARRAIATTPTAQNKAYLDTKADKMGHIFVKSPCNSD